MERRISGRMSEIFARITDGRYRSVEAGRSKNGFRITVWDGQRRIPAERLSRGTLEQIYLRFGWRLRTSFLRSPSRSYWTTYLHFMMTKDWDLYYNGWEAGGSR